MSTAKRSSSRPARSASRVARAPSPPDAAARAALEAIRHVVRALRSSAREAESTVGLSAAQLFVLHRLAEAPALSLNALAERTLTHQSSVSVVVARLVARRLVQRRRSAQDGRRLELAITPTGRALLARAPGLAQDALIAALARMPSARRAQLAALLSALVREMGAGSEPAPLFFEEPAVKQPATRGGARGRR